MTEIWVLSYTFIPNNSILGLNLDIYKTIKVFQTAPLHMGLQYMWNMTDAVRHLVELCLGFLLAVS